jgi:hypothetical protein
MSQEQMTAEHLERLRALPAPQSCRLIDFETAEVRPGFVTGTFILVVSGTKPYANMTVELRPLIYIRRPAYWGIEVVGCLPGFGLPALAPYTVALPLDGVTGTRGVEVLGATRSRRIAVPPRGTSRPASRPRRTAAAGGRA